MSNEFLDSNILIYAFSRDVRAARARELIVSGGVINAHALCEFTNIARRKLRMTWAEISEATGIVTASSREILPVHLETHSDAVRVCKRYGYNIFDALMIASALRAGCATLWSEDMHDGMKIDGRLQIRNPFRAP